MNEAEIVKKISDRFFLTQTEVEEALDYITGKFARELKKGERIYLRNFGSLSKVKRKKRRVRNIDTGRMITIPEYYTIEFNPAELLQKKINPEG